MRRLSSVVALFLFVACGSFTEQPGTTVPPSSDGGQDAPTPRESGAPPPADGGISISTCTSTLASVTADFGIALADATLQNGGKAEAKNGVLHATAKPPSGTTNGVRAGGNWGLANVDGARGTHIEFDFRASYSGTELYGELGCRLHLDMGSERVSDAKLLFTFDNGPQFQLGGRQVDGDGTSASNAPFRFSPYFKATPFDTWHHATFDIAIGTPTSTLVGRIDELPPVSGPMNTPLPVIGISTQCGIIFANASDQQTLSVDISAMTLSACR